LYFSLNIYYLIFWWIYFLNLASDQSSELLASIEVNNEVGAFILLNNDSFVVGTKPPDGITIWNLKTKSQVCKLIGHSRRFAIHALAKLTDEIIASCSTSGELNIWNCARGRLIRNITVEQGYYLRSLLPLKNSSLAASISASIFIWNTTNGQIIRTIEGHKYIIRSMLLLPNGNLVGGSAERSICIWNLTTGLNIKTISSSELDSVNCILLLDNGHKQIASGESDSLIKIWHMETGRLVTYLAGHTGSVLSLVNLKKGHMASGSQDSTINIWNYDNQDVVVLLKTLRGQFNPIRALILCPDGNLLSLNKYETKINIWNLTAIYSYPNRSNLIPYQ
jgi:WD40 repeat protein